MVAYVLDSPALRDLNEPINFDDGLTLGPIEEWMRGQSILSDIGRFQRGYVRSARHTISITYEADSHEDENQQLALERLCLVIIMSHSGSLLLAACRSGGASVFRALMGRGSRKRPRLGLLSPRSTATQATS